MRDGQVGGTLGPRPGVPQPPGRGAWTRTPGAGHDGAVEVLDVLVAAGVGAVLALVVAAAVRASRPPAAGGARGPVALTAGGRAVLVLDVEGVDRGHPAVERLVRDAAARVFALMPGVEEVEVRARDGALLGTSTRRPPPPKAIHLPEQLFEPHPRPTHGPDLTAHLSEEELPTAPPREGPVQPPPAPEAPGILLADRFDLPERVRARVRDPGDAVDLVRAILEAGGVAVRLEDGTLRTDDHAVVIAAAATGVIGREALNRAFLRVQRTGARRGLVIALGYLDRDDVRRREALAPHVLHAGLDGIQRMADAVAVGADPLRFAVAPALAAPAGRPR